MFWKKKYFDYHLSYCWIPKTYLSYLVETVKVNEKRIIVETYFNSSAMCNRFSWDLIIEPAKELIEIFSNIILWVTFDRSTCLLCFSNHIIELDISLKMWICPFTGAWRVRWRNFRSRFPWQHDVRCFRFYDNQYRLTILLQKWNVQCEKYTNLLRNYR